MYALRLSAINTAPALLETPRQAPDMGEVEVEIAACGLNFADLLMISGKYQERPALPLTLGMEVAGKISRTAPENKTFEIGDRVVLFSGHGGLAQYGTFSAERCMRLPDRMTFEDAAAFPIAYGTSHMALDLRARLQPGETVLVLGAAGGVGLTAVEIAAQMGARVIACARGDAKLQTARDAGAHETLDSDREDLLSALKTLGGVDVVYDPVGDPLFSVALRACKPGARYLVIGFAAGEIPKIPANYLLVKNITVHGLYWGGYLKLDPMVLRASLETLLEWYDEGRLKPHISHRLPLDRALEGLEMLRARTSTGKIVITT